MDSRAGQLRSVGPALLAADAGRYERSMPAKIQKWGNSQSIRIAKALLSDAQINVGDDVNIAVKDGCLIVTPTKDSEENMI